MTQNQKPRSPRRRAFLAGSVAAVGTLGTVGPVEPQETRAGGAAPEKASRRPYNGSYEGETLSRVAFPLGGMGAGMLCLEGTGALSHVSLRHQPNIFNEPCVFAAVWVKGEPSRARVLEGPVPSWKTFGLKDSGNGSGGATWGLPRFGRARFEARFPFGKVTLTDDELPLKVEITGWSPFEAGDPDSSSLPFAALEYRLANPTAHALAGVFSWNARNFMAVEKGEKAVRAIPGGFVLWGGGEKGKPWDDGSFCARTDDAEARVNHAWFRGGWFDDLTLAWKDVEEGACYGRPPVSEGLPSPGASVFVPFTLAPGATKAIVVQLSWYVGSSQLRVGDDPEDDEPVGERRYRPWYAKRYSGIEEAAESWRADYSELRQKTARFSDCFHDQTLPPEVVEAVAANLTILKSPTVMRQADGRLWSWEGCGDSWGCCHGSCTHVWNYAQAVPHLFPSLERTLRETEFRVSQDARGHRTFRAALPIRPPVHDFHAAADGQLGGILKVYRDGSQSVTSGIQLGAGTCPEWFYANAGAAGYYRTLQRAAEARRVLEGSHLTAAECLAIADDLGALTASGDVAAGDARRLVPLLASDANRHVWCARPPSPSSSSRSSTPFSTAPSKARRIQALGGPPREPGAGDARAATVPVAFDRAARARLAF